MTDSLFPEPLFPETLFSEPEHEPLWSALQLAGDKPPADADRGEKKNYAQRLSNQLAQTVADALRPLYPNITRLRPAKARRQPSMSPRAESAWTSRHSTPLSA